MKTVVLTVGPKSPPVNGSHVATEYVLHNDILQLKNENLTSQANEVTAAS